MGRQVTIDIARDFSDDPFGRYPKDGPHSGQRFRDECLVPALEEEPELLIIDGDKLVFSPSFLEEAFGGLVRLGFDRERLLTSIQFKHQLESYALEVAEHIKSAEQTH